LRAVLNRRALSTQTPACADLQQPEMGLQSHH
jgi:hypothetical protein